jgi:putative hydrolase of the HAD superfamily
LVRVTRAPISLPGRLVIFDYGEVISLPPVPADRAVIERLAGVGTDGSDGTDGAGGAPAFWNAYYAHRDALDEGTEGARAYWAAIARDIGASWDDARVLELWAADFRGWLGVNPGTIEVLADLKAGGTRMALLSNAGQDFGGFMRHGPLGDYFEEVFVSGELALIKPDPAIFLHVLRTCGVSADNAIFTDNREDNVVSARALGITGHVFTSPPALRSFLTSLR